MFFNGFTLLLMILSVIGGMFIGIKVEAAHQRNKADLALGETKEKANDH